MLSPRMITTAGSTKPHASGLSPNTRLSSGLCRWVRGSVRTTPRSIERVTPSSAGGEREVGLLHRFSQRVLRGCLDEQHLHDGLAQGFRDARVGPDGGSHPRI